MGLDTAGYCVGTQDFLRQFGACRPKKDEPLELYCINVSNYCVQLDHTDNAITDRDFCTQILTSLPSQYVIILMVLKHRRPLPTPEECMHDLLEEATAASLTKELGDASTGAAHFSQCGGYRSHGRGGRGWCGGCSGHDGHGGSSGTGDSLQSKCTYCNIDSHTTDRCREPKRGQEGGNNDECIWFQCRLPGHAKADWVSYRCINKWWKVKKATATAALVTTGDWDPFWLTACALAAATATAAAPPKWVIDSGVSHCMCNDRSSFWTFKMLSLPTVIELGDNNSVTATHYGFINIVQCYHAGALCTPTFWHSPLSINQLDLGGHTTKFWNRKCSITSPSSCSLAGKLINGIYTIVPATPLPSWNTENGKWRICDSSPSIEAAIESSRAPITAKTDPTQKPRTASEWKIWHWRLAHMNPTTMKSLIDRYINDDSMCTVCIQAMHKQRFIKVPVKWTMQACNLVQLHVGGLFGTPTFRDNRYYMLFIDDYTRYTSVWLLPDHPTETCTSAYQSYQGGVDSMRYEIYQFHCANGRGL